MPATRTVLLTEHASRYLQQLCKHWSHKFDVTFDPREGTIGMPSAVLSMRADDDRLTITVTADDPATLDRMESVVADHVRRFAFREELAFEWVRED